MRSMKTAAAAFVALTAVAACGRNDMESSDTATVPAVDTSAGLALPSPMSDSALKADSALRADSVRTDSLTKTSGSKTKKPY